MSKLRPAGVAAIVLTTLLGACLGSRRDGTTEAASGLSPVQLSDIPVPSGMTLRSSLNESHSYEVGQFRVADLHYFGTVPIPEVVNYMRDRMPVNGWRLVEESSGENEAKLVFERRPNRAECECRLDGAVTRLHVAVRTPN